MQFSGVPTLPALSLPLSVGVPHSLVPSNTPLLKLCFSPRWSHPNPQLLDGPKTPTFISPGQISPLILDLYIQLPAQQHHLEITKAQPNMFKAKVISLSIPPNLIFLQPAPSQLLGSSTFPRQMWLKAILEVFLSLSSSTSVTKSYWSHLLNPPTSLHFHCHHASPLISF